MNASSKPIQPISKLAGLRILAQARMPTPPTLLIECQADVHCVPDFVRAHRVVEQWLLRSLYPSAYRYKVGNRVLSVDALLRCVQNWPWSSADFPFALQAFINSQMAGILFVHGHQALAEYIDGSSGVFLRGLAEPARELYEFNEEHRPILVERDQSVNIDITLDRGIVASVIALTKQKMPRVPGQGYITEWIADEKGKIWFVDLLLAPLTLLPQVVPLHARPKTLFPGNFPESTWEFVSDEHRPPFRCTLTARLPRLIIAEWAEKQLIAAVIIRSGSWLSHAIIRAAELRIPCAVNGKEL